MPGAVPHTALTHITVGLGWDPVRAGKFRRHPKDIDLNVAALSFSGTRFADIAFHEQLTSRDGAIRHLGDSLDGVGDGDDEIMVLDLTRLAPDVTTVVLLITCYTGQRFEQIENAFTRVTDSVTGTELARIDLSTARSHTGLVLGKLHRAYSDWQFTLIAEPIPAEHVVDAVPHLTAYLN
ncbi:TerD family protein [Nocardia rhizosphaerihabitans]|uniref:TerD family protein n=1 Tax=Nocardia rhizosphaerihabitans TaxID=1691570 RepID=UPI003672B3E8